MYGKKILPALFIILSLTGLSLMADEPGLKEFWPAKGLAVEKKKQAEKLPSTYYEGFFRNEFNIPDNKKIWKARIEVSRDVKLYINEKNVCVTDGLYQWGKTPAVRKGHEKYQVATISVNIKPFLKRGENCIAIGVYSEKKDPFVYLHGKIVMVDGSVIELKTDEKWKYSKDVCRAWNRNDFNDENWKAAKAKAPAYWKLLYNGNSFIRYYMPIYMGLVSIENPYGPKLFYSNSAPVVFKVELPQGLKERNPVLSYKIYKAEQPSSWSLTEKEIENKLPEMLIADGEIKSYEKVKDSIVYEIRKKISARGIYALKLFLTASDGKLIEERPLEPFAVLGKIPMKEVEGNSYEDGMQLKLEDVINFTDSHDPHSWVEDKGYSQHVSGGLGSYTRRDRPPSPKPEIIKNGQLLYRETAPQRGAHFSYKIKFKHPNSFYLMELEYPDDAERWFAVSCIPSTIGFSGCTRMGPGIWTGDKYPLSNKIRKLKWIYRPGGKDEILSLINLMVKGKRGAAATKLRTFHIENELPALKINGSSDRWFGVDTERAYGGFFKSFKLVRRQEPASYSRMDMSKFLPVARRLISLWQYWDAAEQYARYLRFSGQNIHSMGCFQYDEQNTPYESISPSSSIPGDVHDMAMRVFGCNGIKVLCGIEYSGHRCLSEEYPSSPQILTGKETARMISKDGKISNSWNFLHPRVQELMFALAEDLAEKFKSCPNFAGINWKPYLSGGWLPGFSQMNCFNTSPLDFSYDDTTIKIFEKDTGIKVPGKRTDPERFAQRYKFLCSGTMRKKWTEWRCRKMKDFWCGMRDRLRLKRKNLQLVVSPYVNVHHAVRADSYSGGIKKYMKDLGWDPNLYSNEPNMLMTRWTTAILKSGPALGMGYYQGWMLNTEKDYCDLYPRSQGVYVMHHWDEVPLFTPGAKVYNKKQRKWDYENDWPFSATLGRVEVQAGGENAREPFVQAMIASDPEFILFGFLDANMIVGHEQQLREFVKVFRALPKKEFVRFGNTGFNTNLAIRETKQGDCCFYVANPGYWPVSGQVVLSDAGDIVDLSDNRKAVTKQSGKNTIVPIALKPYGIAAYRVSGRSKLVSWTTKPAPDKELVHMRNIIAQAENILKKQKTNKTLSTEDIAFMERTVRNAEADLTAGKYASAWAYLSNGHFWTLLRNRSGYKKTYEKGMAEYKAKKYKEAAAALEEAAKLAETPDEKYNSMVYQGYSLRNMRKYAESAKIYDNLMKVENLSVAQKNNAFIQYLNNIYSGKKYEDVISTAEKTIADDKASGNMKTIAAFRACLASNNLRKYDDRIKWAKKLQELNPKGIWHSRGLIYQAQTLRTQKKYQEAEELLSKENIAEMHPYRQGEAYLERADIKTAQKKYAEAVLEYTAIYELPKGNPNHKAMAIAYAIEKLNMAGKPEEAQVWIERVDTIKNKYWKTRSLFYQARMLQKQGKLKAAKEKWEECKKSGKWWQKEADKQIAVIDKKLGAK